MWLNCPVSKTGNAFQVAGIWGLQEKLIDDSNSAATKDGSFFGTTIVRLTEKSTSYTETGVESYIPSP